MVVVVEEVKSQMFLRTSGYCPKVRLRRWWSQVAWKTIQKKSVISGEFCLSLWLCSKFSSATFFLCQAHCEGFLLRTGRHVVSFISSLFTHNLKWLDEVKLSYFDDFDHQNSFPVTYFVWWRLVWKTEILGCKRQQSRRHMRVLYQQSCSYLSAEYN